MDDYHVANFLLNYLFVNKPPVAVWPGWLDAKYPRGYRPQEGFRRNHRGRKKSMINRIETNIKHFFHFLLPIRAAILELWRILGLEPMNILIENWAANTESLRNAG